jgi:pimeloyl-ACP methyl ester carboxylesterase
MALGEGRAAANGLDIAYLEAGPPNGPLALCLHGFPDTAHTWRHLLPRLGDAGFRAVAPFLRGYAPTAVPPDGDYSSGALAADALALHEALGGDERAVIVGHDWGAIATYGAAAHAGDRWRRVVTIAVPPLAAIGGRLLSDYRQLKRSFYIWLFQLPMAESAVAADDLAFVAGLWADWSPGYDASEDLAHVRASLGDPKNLAAAIGYYRAMFGAGPPAQTYAAETASTFAPTPQPTLYLHGTADGALGVELVAGARDCLPAPGSDVVVVDGAGHFLHLERPDEVNDRILAFLTA